MSAEDDAKAKKLVLGVLRSKPIAALDFSLDGRTIKPSMYEDVAKARVVNDQQRDALAQVQDIVHECTHAAFDILKIPNMTSLHSETVAYVGGRSTRLPSSCRRKATRRRSRSTVRSSPRRGTSRC